MDRRGNGRLFHREGRHRPPIARLRLSSRM